MQATRQPLAEYQVLTNAGCEMDHDMAITLDIARDNPNAQTVTAAAAAPLQEDDRPTLIGLSREATVRQRKE